MSEVFPFVISADAGIQVVAIPPYRSLDAGVRGHDGTSLRLKARVFNQARRRH